jgi:hypothetical protein
MTGILALAALAGAVAAPGAACSAEQVYHYAITHSRYGAIGAYDRTIDQSGGVTRAQSHLKIAVRVLGIVMHRESADQTEVWRGPRLMSFESLTTTNGKPLKVSGEARDDRFVVTSPTGVASAPADVAASDPLGFNRLGRAEVVSIKSGKIEPITVTGGEADQVMLRGAAVAVRHYKVSTAAQPGKWEVWLDPQGVPVKFRSLEHGDAVDFTLTSPPPLDGPPRALAMARAPQPSDIQ